MSEESKSQFREDEVVILSHFDKASGQQVKTVYPKVGGRLRLAHQSCETLSITTEIVRYDEKISVVSAKVSNDKGNFTGFGMASAERDKRLALSLLELAETRSIARALRFSGYGVEFCGAEEISHLMENGNGDGSSKEPASRPKAPSNGDQNPANYEPYNDSKGENGSTTNGDNGKDKDTNTGTRERLSSAQHKYILSLSSDLSITKSKLNELCFQRFGAGLDFIKRADASELIKEFMGGNNNTERRIQ